MNLNQATEESTLFQYRIVCERCHKTIFYSGQGNGETISVLCDKCTEATI
ncbi:hypothetical protein [Desulfosporosinus nitroreducens]|uniref:GapA-binding peptide SR1P n=1 Tax=Desulfosporosinus nitroreducens TaxID=2018668 RepID=A0ABT8QN62_9FIRM|nr:hypothetical protein [Desulfosporosinus nitroreducens]MCO1603992.1 hypothetical protein [Desulfosporosinus nitroreducens]MDO0822777.1 hypothetical protein [Desulfosporosinus nitroreducens]